MCSYSFDTDRHIWSRLQPIRVRFQEFEKFLDRILEMDFRWSDPNEFCLCLLSVAPKLSRPPLSVRVMEGQSAEFDCRVIGNPFPVTVITWTYDEKPIDVSQVTLRFSPSSPPSRDSDFQLRRRKWTGGLQYKISSEPMDSRASSVAVQKIWNSLSLSVRSSKELSAFLWRESKHNSSIWLFHYSLPQCFPLSLICGMTFVFCGWI